MLLLGSTAHRLCRAAGKKSFCLSVVSFCCFTHLSYCSAFFFVVRYRNLVLVCFFCLVFLLCLVCTILQHKKVPVTVVLIDILTERLIRKVCCQFLTVFKRTVSRDFLLQVSLIPVANLPLVSTK